MSAVTNSRLKTWHAATRIERILKTKQVPFSGDPHALVKCAVEILPAFQPTGAVLLFNAQALTFSVYFGHDRKGTTWSVEFDIAPESFLPFLKRVMAGPDAEAVGMARMAVTSEDGGEELPLPRLSPQALAHVSAISPAIN